MIISLTFHIVIIYVLIIFNAYLVFSSHLRWSRLYGDITISDEVLQFNHILGGYAHSAIGVLNTYWGTAPKTSETHTCQVNSSVVELSLPVKTN